MKKDNSRKDAEQRPEFWEDSIILAFRDLQWIHKNRANFDLAARFQQAIATRSCTSSLLKKVIKGLTEASNPPALLAKLDGNAESASGDVLTSSNQRFFLFEFKADKGSVRSEKVKSVFQHIRSLYENNKLKGHKFVTLSRRGHHVVYPVLDDDITPGNRKDGLLAIHRVKLQTRTYFDGVVLGDVPKSPLPVEWWEKEQIAENLLYAAVNSNSFGLNIFEMSAYLRLLIELHGEDSGHPIKIVLASNEGFFWPGGSLSRLHEMAQYFDLSQNLVNEANKNFTKDGVQVENVAELYEQLKDLLPESPNPGDNAPEFHIPGSKGPI